MTTSNSTPRVLVVDDEADLRQVLTHHLSAEGHDVRAAETGEQACELVRTFSPQLVLLDIMLPDISGFEVCRRIRTDTTISQPRVVMLTASGDEIDRVVGFELGADDYVVKPFSVRELMLRVRAHLRAQSKLQEKAEAERPEESTRGQRVYEMGPLTIDLDRHRVLVNKEEVSVSVLEMQVLVYLAQARENVCPRSELLRQVWRYSAEVTSRTVDTHIKRLRDKLGVAGSLIQTVRGVGYRLSLDLGTRKPAAETISR